MLHGSLLFCSLTQSWGLENIRPPWMAEARLDVPMADVAQCKVQKVCRVHADVSQEFLCPRTDLTSDFKTIPQCTAWPNIILPKRTSYMCRV